MKVMDNTITEEIKRAENKGQWILCLCLLELKQLRLERRFNGIMSMSEGSEEYVKTKIKI